MSIYPILTLIFVITSLIGLWKIFEKAGKKGWLVLIPFYNFWIWLKIIDKPWWWYIFIMIPFINVFTLMLMVVELDKCFKKNGLGAQALSVLFPFAYLPYLGFSPKENYTHPDRLPHVVKSAVREWADAIIFAVIAATIIRTFFIEAYTIPTSSMEKSLLVGDFLFVSKINYGPKIPNTPLAFPFVHHTLPLTKTTKSYVEWLKLPYYRFPGFQHIKNNDVVVFNYPDGDTVALNRQNQSYYSLVRESNRYEVWHNKREYGDIVARPVDKRENYIKRCIGIAGDSLQIKDQEVYINGSKLPSIGKKEYKYIVTTNDGMGIGQKVIDKFDITEQVYQLSENDYAMTLTDDAVNFIKTMPTVKNVKKIVYPKGQWDYSIFPNDSIYKWNIDNFGPIFIPKRGATITLNHNTLLIYRRCIEIYEGNKVDEKDGKVLINGSPADKYTFKYNYYWMMGDNRHNSADSRYWGFVPEDHIVGKAIFIWLSLDEKKNIFDGKIRWSRMFGFVK
jgi:signal peptidase I